MRCIRLYTENNQTRVQQGKLSTQLAERGDYTTEALAAEEAFFKHTPAGSAGNWHLDPARQFVITLQGSLLFETECGVRFELHAGDLLLTEETAGQGHRWQLLGDEPWVRVYIRLATDAVIPFEVSQD